MSKIISNIEEESFGILKKYFFIYSHQPLPYGDLLTTSGIGLIWLLTFCVRARQAFIRG